jgi:hypothetical protein
MIARFSNRLAVFKLLEFPSVLQRRYVTRLSEQTVVPTAHRVLQRLDTHMSVSSFALTSRYTAEGTIYMRVYETALNRLLNTSS